MGEPFSFDWKGSLTPERKGGPDSSWRLDWKASLIPVQPLEVKNTFVHVPEEDEFASSASRSRRTASSPPDLRTPVQIEGDGKEEDETGASCSTEAPTLQEAAATGPAASADSNQASAHDVGSCRPCAYFRIKADGCQKGDACEFCHLCTLEDVRAKQTLYKRQARAQKRATASKARAPPST
ncbi:adck1 [Symbiodinium sp. CCMP2592]|nr:adck1 [Symbiodinium sp. CCMP2592]